VRTTRFLFVSLLGGIASNSYKALIVRYLGTLHDELAMGYPSFEISYPLNFLYGCGKQPGVSTPFVIIVPTLILSKGVEAQEVESN